MLLSDASADYILHARHGLGLTQSTCSSYQSELRYFIKWLEENGYPNPDLSTLSTPILRKFLYAQSAAGKRPRTIHGHFYAIKALVVFLMAQGALDHNPVDKIQLPQKDAASRPIASDQECAGILAACDKLRTPRRRALAKAIFSTLIFAGLRAMEVLDIKLDDVSFDRKTLTVAQGKGQKSRLLYPSAETLAALRAWMDERSKGRTIETPYLFAYDPRRRIAYNGLLQMLKEVKLIAGYADREHIKPHSLRRAFATRLMEKGASIRTIQSALGHSDAQTTLVYMNQLNDAARPMSELAALIKPTPPTPTQPPTLMKPDRAADISRRRRTPAR